MAATLCGAIDNRCSLTIDINLCVLSGMAWYVRCKVLNLACIDSAPCSPIRPNPAWVCLALGTT